MSQFKECNEVLNDLGNEFKLSDFEHNWIENNFFEIQSDHIPIICNSLNNYYKRKFEQSENENIRHSEINLIIESIQSNLISSGYNHSASLESLQNFKIVQITLKHFLTELLNETKIIKKKSDRVKQNPSFQSYEISLILNQLIENGVFSPDATKAEIAEAFSFLTGYHTKTLQNGLGQKSLETYSAKQYTVSVRRLFDSIIKTLNS